MVQFKGFEGIDSFDLVDLCMNYLEASKFGDLWVTYFNGFIDWLGEAIGLVMDQTKGKGFKYDFYQSYIQPFKMFRCDIIYHYFVLVVLLFWSLFCNWHLYFVTSPLKRRQKTQAYFYYILIKFWTVFQYLMRRWMEQKGGKGILFYLKLILKKFMIW